MSDETEPEEKKRPSGVVFEVGGAMIAFGFVWIVFDNLVLAIFAAMLVGGGFFAAKKG